MEADALLGNIQFPRGGFIKKDLKKTRDRADIF